MSATKLGLVPGFAQQDGDQLAALFDDVAGNTGGGFGLGPTANPNFSVVSSAGGTPVPVTASVTVVTGASVTGSLIQLVDIPISTSLRIYNYTAQAIDLAVYPPDPTQQIDTYGPGNPVALSSGNACDYLYLGGGVWVSDVLGAPSN